MKRCTKILSFALALLMMVTILPLGISVSAATTVTAVYATVPTPVIGHSISKTNDCFTPTEGVTITDLNWTKENGAIYPSGTKFQAGVTYYCDIEFTVEAGYTFPSSYTQLKGYINEKAGEISTVYYTDHAYVTVPFKATQDGEIFVGGLGMNDGDYLHMGSDSTSKTKKSERYAYYKDGVLTLNNYTYQGSGLVMEGVYSYFCAAILSDQPLEIKVNGRCSISNTSNARYALGIYFFGEREAKGNVITGVGESLLQISSPYTAIYCTGGVSIKDGNISVNGAKRGIESYDNITIDNSTIYLKTSDIAWHTSGNVSVTNSKLDITSESSSGIQIKGDATFNDVTADITAYYCPIYSPVDSEKGNSADISIMSGTFNLVSKAFICIYSEETLLLYNSTVEATALDYCFYSKKDFSVVSSSVTTESGDDAFKCYDGKMFIMSSDLIINNAGDDGIENYSGNINIISSDITVSQADDCGIECHVGEELNITGSTLDLKGDYGIYAERNTNIENSTVKIEGGEKGIILYDANLTIKESNIESTSTEDSALWVVNGNITFGEGLTVQASTQQSGTLGAYNPAQGKDYCRVKVTKAAPLTIVTQPTDVYGKEGETVNVTVTAQGEGLTYQWYIQNAGSSTSSKSSVTSATYSVKLSSKTHNRRIYCIVKDKDGNELKTNTVQIYRQASITKEPSTVTYAQKGAKAKVKFTALGDELKYTWYVKNSGASKYSKSSVTSATYTVTMSDKVKGRRVYCVVTDKYGKTAQSKTTTLRESVSITTQPKTVTVKKNATAKVSVKASGDELKYSWYVKNSGASKYSKSSVTKSSYSVKMTTKVKNRLVYCVVTDKYGKTVKSSTVRLKMK